MPPRSFVYDTTSDQCYLPFEQGLSDVGIGILILLGILIISGIVLQFLLRRAKTLSLEAKIGKKTGAELVADVESFLLGTESITSSYASSKEAIWHGLTNWYLRQMRHWEGDDRVDGTRYNLCWGLGQKFIVGIGLPLFYNFQWMIFVSAMLSAGTLYLIDVYSGLETLIEEMEQDAEYRHHTHKSPAFRLYAESMFYGLGFLYCTLVLVSQVHARMQRSFSKWFDITNSTMNDYTLELRGVPVSMVHEEDLRHLVERNLQCAGQVVGVSIAYDLAQPEVQNTIWKLYEHAIVQSDVEFFNLGQTDMKDLKDPIAVAKATRNRDFTLMGFGYSPNLAFGDQLDKQADEKMFKTLWDCQPRKLRGSGRAYIVFKSKSSLDATSMRFNGFWATEVMTATTDGEVAALRAAFGPTCTALPIQALQDASERLMEDASDRLLHTDRASEQDPLLVQQRPFAALNRRVYISEDELEEGTKVMEPHSIEKGVPFTVERFISMKDGSFLEPTNNLWFNFGVPEPVQQKKYIEAVIITLAVFLVIILVVYLPLFYFMSEPWGKAPGGPGPVASQVQGILLAIAGNILGFANWQGISRIGIIRKSEQDMSFLMFSLVTGFFNTVFFLGGDMYSMIADDFGFGNMTGNGENVPAVVLQEVALYEKFVSTLMPGWLFSGVLIGKLMGWIMPLLQNYLLCQVVFNARCLPRRLNSILCTIIPGNPSVHGLTARAAETVFSPPEVALAWEYGQYIVTPTVCFCVLFGLGADSWKVFAYLSSWVIFMYLLHRFPSLTLSKKAMQGRRLQVLANQLWGIPVATVLAAASFWGVRAEKLGRADYSQSYWIVACVFLVGLFLHQLLLPEDLSSQAFDLHDTKYQETKSKMGCTWFNTNPVNVLKARHYKAAFVSPESQKKHIPLLCNPSEDLLSTVPFEYGKEYLLRLIDHKDQESSSVTLPSAARPFYNSWFSH